MESFYKHWLKNKNITKSICLSQNDIINRKDTIIRNHQKHPTSFQIRRNQKYGLSTILSYNDTIIKTYKAPDYWAPFVVYDAFPIKTNIISDRTKDFVKSFLKENIIGSSQVVEDLQQWEALKSSLSNDESIVLMYNYTLPSMDEEYVALILSNKYNTGRIVPLFVNKFNTKYSKEDIVGMEALADSIWSKLNTELAYSQHIYFRPSGILSKIPFENILQFKLSNSLYRITSLQTLINRRIQRPKVEDKDNHICLIGAFEYHSDFSYLPSSLSEIETIENCYNRDSKNCVTKITKSYKDSLLYNLENANILHFSTHCGVIPISQMPNLPQEQDFDIKQLRICEHSSLSDLMLSSHLMTFASNDSDYVVSALDVSKLDLSKVDLCVLATSNSLYAYSTSCQDFGFLKGLKLAGVRSILGSLWDVDDVATQKLMSQFYASFASGKSKRQSLLDAQHYIREYEDLSKRLRGNRLTVAVFCRNFAAKNAV
jgi:hypothetical protein